MSDADQLKALRVRIDSLDERILELISERARCAQEVAGSRPLRWPRASRRCSTARNAKPGCSNTSWNSIVGRSTMK